MPRLRPPFGPNRRRVETVTGRTVCEDCRDDVLAAAAGVIADPGTPVQGAIETQGWFRRIRSFRRTRP